jgi:hypothetical protein
MSISSDRTRRNTSAIQRPAHTPNKRRKTQSTNSAADSYYERPDWTLFRTIPTLCQQAGVPPNRLRRLIAKELVDNALDVANMCEVGELPDDGFFVEDDGPGIPGSPEEIARLFSFGRPFVSSKLKRLPTRGALGQGLRCVAGTVFASGGRLRVLTHGLALELTPQESGDTTVKVGPSDRTKGARVEVWLGDSVPYDPGYLSWAKTAIWARGVGPIYSGMTSPWWYDSDAFFELLQAGRQRTVADVVERDFGLADVPQGKLRKRVAASLTYEEAEELLGLLRSSCEPIGADELALLGKSLPGSYAKALGTLTLKPGRGDISAELPFTVEAWCERAAGEKDRVTLLVNRTPVTGNVSIQRQPELAEVAIFGCNLGYRFTVGKKRVAPVVNVQTPYMPLTSNGKEPDLEPFVSEITAAIEKAAKKCSRANRPDETPNGFLPVSRRGRRSDEDKRQCGLELRRFAERLKEINSRFDFQVSARGFCYILENDGLIEKGEFDKVQELITDCRKLGLLPINFTAEDDARRADNLEHLDDGSAESYAESLAHELGQWANYRPISFWDHQPVYIQIVVEKIDLKYLFLPICRLYGVPIINMRGWSDLNLRAGLMRRFQEHERKGRRPVLLCAGDHDPVGLQMTDLILKHLTELESAVGWSPRNLTVDRFGLNADFIEAHNLTWIEGLKTASGKDLADPNHKQHNANFVQQYLANYGARKVEANALVIRPEAGRQLCRQAIEKYLDLNAIAAYERSLAGHRERVKRALPAAVAAFLEELKHGRHEG